MPNVNISYEALGRIEEYANFVGISVERAASEAIEKWMDETGKSVMTVLERRRRERSARAKLTLVKRAG